MTRYLLKSLILSIQFIDLLYNFILVIIMDLSMLEESLNNFFLFSIVFKRQVLLALIPTKS